MYDGTRIQRHELSAAIHAACTMGVDFVAA